MTWADLIIIFVAASLRMAMNYLDTMPGYSCPIHCGVQHKHYFVLDLQSDPILIMEENTKANKNSDLADK